MVYGFIFYFIPHQTPSHEMRIILVRCCSISGNRYAYDTPSGHFETKTLKHNWQHNFGVPITQQQRIIYKHFMRMGFFYWSWCTLFSLWYFLLISVFLKLPAWVEWCCAFQGGTIHIKAIVTIIWVPGSIQSADYLGGVFDWIFCCLIYYLFI